MPRRGETGRLTDVATSRRHAHNRSMGISVWLLVIVAGVIGICGYSASRGWGGRGPGSFHWWRSNRRRGWWL
jgi:hypothetical protein